MVMVMVSDADVSIDLRQHLANPRRTPQRVFIGGELDSISDSELALEFFDRLARGIRVQLPDLHQCGIDNGHHREAFG